MKRRIGLLISLALGITQCSRSDVDRRERTVPPGIQDPTAADPMVDIPLLELPANGTQMRFLDAIALTEIYSRVFIRDANQRWKGCGNDPAWCRKSIFNKDEAKFLGTFSLVDGVDSFRVKKDFSLNYTRTLRAMLYRECRNLVEIEWQRFAPPGNIQENVLVFRQAAPETTDLDRFSRRIFGLMGTDIPIDNMAAEYQAAFVASLAGKTDAATLKSGYVVACMALAMDPSVFLY